MSVTEVSLTGIGYVYNPSNKNQYFIVVDFGSAVEVGAGLYLTAAHVAYDPILASELGISNSGYLPQDPQFSTYVINPSNVTYQSVNGLWDYKGITGGSSISNPNSVSGYSPNLTTGVPAGNDIASFTAASAGTPTGVVLFLNPTHSVMSKAFSSVSFTGYIPGPVNASGVQTESPITSSNNTIASVNQNNQTFALSSNVGGPGASGAGVWGTEGGANYVLGTVLGTNGTNALASYITPNEFYTLFPLGPAPSTTTHNLIVGSASGNNDIRGTFQTTDILGEGNNNLILAGGNSDTINPGPGISIIFSSTVDGVADTSGTTYVLGAGSTEIVGGSANDKLVLLADRLSSRTNAIPSSSAISSNSQTIQLLGGWGSIPGSTFGGYTVPALGSYSLDTGSNAAGANSWNQLNQLIGNYAYDVTYSPSTGPDGKEDLNIGIYAYNLAYNASTGTGGPADLWVGSALILDYQPGDFGLKFTASPDYQEAVTGQITQAQYEADQQALSTPFISSPTASTHVNDDPTTTWQGVINMGVANPSVATLTSDLASLIKAT